MRKISRMILRSAIILLSLDAFFFIFSDLFGSWQVVQDLIAHHPAVAATLKGPYLPLMCLGVCLLIVYGEKYLKLPDLRAEYLRVEVVPEIGGLSVPLFDEIFTKIQKRETYDLNADILVEIYLVNHSEYEVTVRSFAAELYIQRSWLVRFPRISSVFPKKKIVLTKAKQLAEYKLKSDEMNSNGAMQATYEGVDDLESILRGVPLTRGVGYQGWLGFTGTKIDRHDFDNTQIKIIVKDALDNNHPVLARNKDVGTVREYEKELVPPL